MREREGITDYPPCTAGSQGKKEAIVLPDPAPASQQAAGSVQQSFDQADRIDDWLYLPETLYAFMLMTVVSADAGPYSLDALILGLMNKHVA